MNPYDEELQKKIEGGVTPDNEDLDTRAYQKVFRALKKDPGYEIPGQFAENVLHRVVSKEKKGLFNDYFWFFAGILFVLISSIVTIMLTGFRLNFGFLTQMSDYKGLALFGIVFIIFINWLDKRLVRHKFVQE